MTTTVTDNPDIPAGHSVKVNAGSKLKGRREGQVT